MSEENQELRVYSRTHLGGDGNPKSVLLNDEQESYALSLGFKGKESFARRWIVGEVLNNRNIVVGGISNISWSKLEVAMEGKFDAILHVRCAEPCDREVDVQARLLRGRHARWCHLLRDSVRRWW